MASGGVTLSREAHRRTGNAVRHVERQQAEGFIDSRGRPTKLPVVGEFKIAALATGKGKYTLTLLNAPVADLNATSDLVEGDVGTAHVPASGYTYVGFAAAEIGLTAHLLRVGRVCSGIFHRVQSDGQISVILLAEPPAMMPVKVTVDGGTAGSDSTTCSFTYTVASLAGSQLGTAKTPLRHRYTNVEHNEPAAASYGQAFYDGTTLVLVEAYEEYPLDVDCEEAV
jgi:hypothetical protein